MLSFEGISKRFGSCRANDGISFAAESGRITAILGQNGAGKTTLLRILAGEERPDSGSILLDGKELSLGDPAAAARAGIALVHQHPSLPPGLSFSEALSLGHEPLRWGLFLDRKRMLLHCTEELRDYGGGIDPDAPLESLGFATRQRAELLRSLSRGAEVIALDEPTSSLSSSEADGLYDLLARLAGLGKTILIVTHRLEEVVSRSLDCVVLREGRVRGTASHPEERRLSGLLFGQGSEASAASATAEPPLARPQRPVTESAVLRLEGLGAPSYGANEPAIGGIDLALGAGETCAVLALDGNGLDGLEAVLSASRRASEGRISIDGKDASAPSMGLRRQLGMAYVPSERQRRGLPRQGRALDAILADERSLHYAFPRRNEARMRSRAAELALPLGLSLDWEREALALSGGEAQRLILARETAAASRVLVACDPFLGLDPAGREIAQRALRGCARRGAAVLLLSNELQEVEGLADRAIVLYRGHIAGSWVAPFGELASRAIREAMTGLTQRRSA